MGQDGEGQSARPAHAAANPNPVMAIVVGLFPPPAMIGDVSWQHRGHRRGRSANDKRSHPGSELFFWLGECAKENHGWHEGPPLTESWLEFRSVEGRHPPVYSTRTKKEYCRLPPSANALILGIGRYTAVYQPLSLIVPIRREGC